MNSSNKKFIAILTYLLIPISGLGIDIYVPSLPAVTDYFRVDNHLVQLTITSYMLGLGLMQLLAGPIVDSLGRRKPFLVFMAINIITTLLVPCSTSIWMLLILRFLQGSSAGMAIVPLRAVTLDLFEGQELAKMANYLTIAWAIGPIIAPAIGGYLQHYFGWQACFYFLASYSIIILSALFVYLPETILHKQVFSFSLTLQRFVTILTCAQFLTGLAINSALYSLIILFSIIGPFLLQDHLHYTPIQFGQIALLMGFSWFLGNVTNRFLLYWPVHAKTRTCLSLMAIFALSMLICTYIFPLNIYNIILPILSILFLGGLVFPNIFTRTLSLFPKLSGSANALFGSLVFFLSGLIGGMGTLLKANTAAPLAMAYLILISIALLLTLKGKSAQKSLKVP